MPAPDRPLDSLSRDELRAVCFEDARRADPCMEKGLREIEPGACEQVVAECREQGDASTPTCQDVRTIENCPVTVAEFFDCVDAWNETQTCENAFIVIEPPEPCVPVTDCDDFKFEFEQFGRAPPCTPEPGATRPDIRDDIYGLEGCYPVPDRFIAYGNSIVGNASRMLADHVRALYAPGLEYDDLAASGGLGGLDDLERLSREAGVTEGHLALWIYTFPEDRQDPDIAVWKAQLGALMSHFSDPSVTTGGVTFMLNTQYSPSDQCPDAPGFVSLSLAQEALLQEVNRQLFIEPALERVDTVTIDQYPDWLGHGWNAGAEGCPHCYEDNTLWQADPIHPNALGQEHIFQKWRVAVDRMYGASCD